MIRPDSQIVPVEEKTRGTTAHPATAVPNAFHASQNVAATTAIQSTVPPLTSVYRVGPPGECLRVRRQQGQNAHVRRSRIVPAPVPMDRVEQRQPVDGQVAVEMILGVQDQRRESRPSTRAPHPAPPRASEDVDRSRRGAECSWETGTDLVADSDEEVGNGTTEAGELGEVSIISPSRKKRGSPSPARYTAT